MEEKIYLNEESDLHIYGYTYISPNKYYLTPEEEMKKIRKKKLFKIKNNILYQTNQLFIKFSKYIFNAIKMMFSISGYLPKKVREIKK